MIYAAFISGLILAGSLIAFRKIFFTLARNSVSLLDKLLSDEDEDAKVASVSRAVGGTLRSVLWFFLWILGTGIAFCIPIYVAAYLSGTDNPWPGFGLYPVLAMSVGSIIPFLFLKRDPGQEYSEMSKLLHEIVLDNYNLGRKLFRIQTRKSKNPKEDFVIVSGLARSGTTALTINLSERGPFRSLNYAHMPFLMAPKFWSRINRAKTGTLKERKHGDQVRIGLDSVEALEEYFFKLFTRDAYIAKDYLVEHKLEEEVYRAYLRYQRSIAGSNHYYLAKNNNLILRLQSLRQYNTIFRAIFLFRDPMDHARSLMNQHERFTHFQSKDPFILQYMNWLGHHEFGLGHKPFQFEGQEIPRPDPNTLDYWLSIWTAYYSRLLEIREHYHLFDYQDFLEHPEAFMKTLAKELTLDIEAEGMKQFEKPERSSELPPHDPVLREKAMTVYRKLVDKKVPIRASL